MRSNFCVPHMMRRRPMRSGFAHSDLTWRTCLTIRPLPGKLGLQNPRPELHLPSKLTLPSRIARYWMHEFPECSLKAGEPPQGPASGRQAPPPTWMCSSESHPRRKRRARSGAESPGPDGHEATAAPALGTWCCSVPHAGFGDTWHRLLPQAHV